MISSRPLIGQPPPPFVQHFIWNLDFVALVFFWYVAQSSNHSGMFGSKCTAMWSGWCLLVDACYAVLRPKMSLTIIYRECIRSMSNYISVVKLSGGGSDINGLPHLVSSVGIYYTLAHHDLSNWPLQRPVRCVKPFATLYLVTLEIEIIGSTF